MAREFSAKDAKNLIAVHGEMLSSLKETARLPAALREKIDKAVKAAVAREVLKVLDGVPVDELGREKRGIRTKLLAEHGFQTMADVYTSSVRELASVRGIGEETARTAKQIASALAAKTQNEVRIRLNADDKNAESTALVTAISVYKNSLPYIRECKRLVSAHGREVTAAMEDLKPAASGLRWFFTSKQTKLRAQAAYTKLKALSDGEYFVSARAALATLKSISATSPIGAWQDFTSDTVRFYNILEEIAPNVLGTDDALYGLPEDLAREVQEQCFFPDGLKCTLRRYQEWGVKYILHQEKVLLGDEMGLGKTVQAIAAMVSLRNTGATHFLVICPASVVTNWCREIARHSLLRAVKVHGGDRDSVWRAWRKQGGVAVTTYETVSRLSLPREDKIGMIVVDEAHYIKNPEAKRTLGTVALCAHSDRILLMTGTALENRVDEMISLISILRPDLVRGIKSIAFMSSAPQFRLRVAPVYYRRRREDVLTELPELIESREWCAMPSTPLCGSCSCRSSMAAPSPRSPRAAW